MERRARVAQSAEAIDSKSIKCGFESRPGHSPPMGYDLDATANRFANYLHVLRELVHLAAGQLALEPRLEVKALLADHLHDDARAAAKIERRLTELGREPGTPGDELAALLDRAYTQPYLETAYGELKPTLIQAVRTHLEDVDPLLDEPGLRILTQLRHRQERHTTELPAQQRETHDLAEPPKPGETPTLRVLPRLETPARDAFVEITDGHRETHPIHDLMQAAICDAELASRTAHEHPAMPLDFHVDMARQTWDKLRHAEVLDRLMATELDCHWGDHAVSFAAFNAVYARDLAGRLEHLSRTTERREPHAVFDYLHADEAAHAATNARWIHRS